MQVISGAITIGTQKRSTLPAIGGGWMARAGRVGQVTPTSVVDGFRMPVQWADQRRIFSAEQLWRIYHINGDVRGAVNSIARRVATWKWVCRPSLDPSDPEYEVAAAAAEDAERFLRAPNNDGESWQTLVTKILIDLLVFDAAAVEIVRDRKGRVAELVSLRGCDIRPVVDQHGVVHEYVQNIPATNGATVTGLQGDSLDRPTWKPENLLYFRLFPNNAGPEGLPLLESVVNEVCTIIRASDHALKAVDADEIPPGILMLAGLSGDALNMAKQEFQANRGLDNKIRILSTPNPAGGGVQWVELRHTPKDIGLIEVFEQCRRVVWRVFGVMPIEMGETDSAPRASTETQTEVGQSHLIEPILGILSGGVVNRLLPLLLPPELLGKVTWEFDIAKKHTPAEQNQLATRLVQLVTNGILSRNEAREELDYLPVEENGDELTTSAAVIPLSTAFEEPEPPVDATPDGEGGPLPAPEGAVDPSGGSGSTDGGSKVAAPEAGEPADEPAPGENDGQDAEPAKPKKKGPAKKAVRAPGRRQSRRPAKRRYLGPSGVAQRVSPSALVRMGRAAEAAAIYLQGAPSGSLTSQAREQVARDAAPVRSRTHVHRSARHLPSEWQPEGKFKGKRTVDLSALAEAVGTYGAQVDQLWDVAMAEVVSACRQVAEDDRVTDDEYASASSRVGQVLDGLASDWSTTTKPLYQRAAKIGRDAACKVTAKEVARDHAARADAYHARAMGFLRAGDGPIAQVRQKVLAALHEGQQARARERQSTEFRSTLDARGPGATIMAAVESAVSTAKWRIDNWAGKLVDLASSLFAEGASEGGAPSEPSDAQPAGGAEPWMYEWVAVGDDRECRTCREEAAAGFRYLSQQQRVPGSSTECGANDRCVIVLWSESEVRSGAATSLN